MNDGKRFIVTSIANRLKELKRLKASNITRIEYQRLLENDIDELRFMLLKEEFIND